MRRQPDSGINAAGKDPGSFSLGEIAAGQVIPAALAFMSVGWAAALSAGAAYRISLLPAVLVGLVLCALPLVCRRRLSKLENAVAGACLLIFTVIFIKKISDGLCIAVNGWCDLRTEATGILKTGFKVKCGESEESLCLMFFSISASGVLALGAAVAAEAKRMVLPAVCLGTALGYMLLLKEQASYAAVGVITAAGVVILIIQAAPSGVGTAARSAAVNTAVVLALAAVLTGICSVLPGVGSGKAFESLAEGLCGRLHSALYEKDGEALPEGDFTDLGGKISTGREVLRITGCEDENIYLRGFVGEVYTGAGWRPLDNSELAENSDVLCWLHKNRFYPQTQPADTALLTENEVDIISGRITVENVGACGKYLYIPYNALAEGCEDVLTEEKLEPDMITSKAAFRQGRSYRVINGVGESASEILGALDDTENTEIRSYRGTEALYRDFVYKYSLYVPEAVRAELTRELEKYCDGEITPEKGVKCVERFLKDKMTFKDDTDTFSGEEDFVSWTLKSGEGYDVHYATLTVLALRCCGIPARYVEGYIAEGKAQEGIADGWISVDDSCAHAWTEVYQEGIGWIPLDLTPGYSDFSGRMQQAGEDSAGVSDRENMNSEVGTVPGEGDRSNGNSGAEYDIQQEQDSQTSDENGNAPDDMPESRTAIAALKKSLPWLLLIIPAAVLVLVIRRRYIMLRRRKLFNSENTADAVGWCFAYAAMVLKTVGIDRKNGSMTDVEEAVEKKLGVEYRRKFGEMYALNCASLFSGRQLCGDSGERMNGFAAETVEAVKKKTGVFKRIKNQWIKCVY